MVSVNGPTESRNWKCPEKHRFLASVPKLAAALSMSVRTLENYIKRYGLRQTERGWSTASVVRVLREEEAKLREEDQKKEPAQAEGLTEELTQKLALAQAKLIIMKAEREEIRLEKEKRRLVYRDSADTAIHEVRSFVVDRLESIVRGLPREVRGEVEPQVVAFMKELQKRTGELWLEQPQ